MFSWKIDKITLPLKRSWFVGDAVVPRENFVVTVEKDDCEGRGEVAWSIRFNESEKQILGVFDLFCRRCPKDIAVLEDLLALFEEMDIPNSLKSGIESAYVQLLAQISNRSVQKIIGVNTVRAAATSFCLPALNMRQMEIFVEKNNLDRFQSLKIKLLGSVSENRELLSCVRSLYKGKLRLEGGENFHGHRDFLSFIEQFSDYPIEFVGQPISSELHEEHLKIKKSSPFPIFADESLGGQGVTDYFSERFHGVNVKLMKSGGHFKALRQMRQARERGLKVELGCMVESSLGVSAALTLASKADYVDLSASLALEKDPWQLISEENGTIFFSDMH